jgi:hypothetical protein
MSEEPSGDVAKHLRHWKSGDKRARGELLPLVYDELQGVARAWLHRQLSRAMPP